MLKIGLTGGIGSGKTTIAKIFATLGIPVYDADSSAKRLMENDESLKKAIVENLGTKAYDGKSLNRTFLGEVVFNNPEKLKILNDITHPATINDSINWFNLQHNVPYAIKEAALIFESGSEQYLDFVIGVWAPEDLRIERLLQRGGLTVEQIKERISRQMDETEKMSRCDFNIKNDKASPIIPQVYELHQKLKNLS